MRSETNFISGLKFLTNPTLRMGVRLVCLAACIAMFLAALLIYHADIGGLLIFALFLIVYVQLPGQLILRLLSFRPDHTSTLLATGLFTGWAFLTLQYFITELIHTNLLLYALGPICTILWLISFFGKPRQRQARGSATRLARKRRARFSIRFRDISPAFCIFVTIALFYAMVMTQYLYLSPDVDKIITMNPDKAFHLGLINSLSHGWPLECPWFAGLYYNYHIFTELLYSVPVRLFGLTADTLLFTCGPYLTVYAFGISLYSLFREMSARPQRAGLYCLALLLANLFIARSIDQSIAYLFIFRNENVAGYGVSATLVLVVLIRYWYRDHAAGGFAWKKFLVLLAVLMLATGIKGPFGLVIVAALWGTWVLGLILRQAKFRTILPLILLSAGFYVVYSIILGSKGQTVSAGESLIALGTIIDITFYKGPLVALMKGIGLPGILRYGVLLFVFTVCLLTAFFLPFVIGYIRELVLVLSKKNDFDFSRVLVYAAVLIGYIAMMLLNYHGHSQIYFGFVTVFLAPLIGFWFFEDLEGNRSLWMKLIRVIFAICLVLSCVGLACSLLNLTGDAVKSADPHAKGKKYVSMNHGEYKAMRWIDKNTPRDSLLATDRYYSVNPLKFDVTDRWDNRYFLYADYANRICYLAGAGYNLPARDWQKRADRIAINDRFYNADDPERGELAKSLGIDYVVVSKRFTDAGDLENDCYKLCFSNKAVDIYEITE